MNILLKLNNQFYKTGCGASFFTRNNISQNSNILDKIQIHSLLNLNIIFFVLFIGMFIATPSVKAQSGEGVLGWSWDGTYYPTASAACKSQWEWSGMNNGKSRFIGSFPVYAYYERCAWTSYQYLCPQETGGAILDCWTVMPASVGFYCSTGYQFVGHGQCMKEPVREKRACSANFGGSRNDSVGNPILLESGSKFYSVEDFSTDDKRFRIERNYRSSPQFIKNNSFAGKLRMALGGWSFGFALEFHLADTIEINGGGAGTIYSSDGTAYNFSRRANIFSPSYGYPTGDYKIEFVGTPPSDWKSVFSASSQWRVTESSGRIWLLQTFSPDNASSANYSIARPIQITERDGYKLTLSYGSKNEVTSIKDSFGRIFTFTWQYFNITSLSNVAGALPVPEGIREITLPDGGKIRYTYDVAPASGASLAHASRLDKVERFDASATIIQTTTYHYEDVRFPAFLTGVTDGRGVRYATYAYDGQGRSILTEHAGAADKYTIEYNTVPGNVLQRKVTNPLGKTTTYQYKYDPVYQGANLTSVDGLASTNCPSSARSYTYDGNPFIVAETDEEGRVTAYTRDSAGRPLTVTRGSGTSQAVTTTLTWDTGLNVPTRVVDPGLTTNYVWGAAGTLSSQTQTDTTSHTVPYATGGQTRTWAYGYGAAGLLTSVDGPLAGAGDRVSYTYDAQGYVKTVTNELGHVTTVDTVNGRGQPTLVTDSNGVKTAMTYDGRGWLLMVKVDSTGTAATTTMAYDGVGQITRITQPDGSWQSFTYDNARRLRAVTTNAGETTTYVRDAMGGATSITRKKANATATFARTQSFDELGRLLRAIGANSSAWRFGYDRTDNLVAVTDPRSNLYNYGFDALNRLISETDEENQKAEVTRNGVDAIASYKDARNVTTSYVRNGFGEIIRAASPDSGTVVYRRDARGLITSKTDGRGVVMNQTFDNAGRILTRTFPSATGLNVGWTYDAVSGGNRGKGRLTGMSDASGTTAWVYDARGNVLSETRVIGARTYVVSYAYNLADKVTRITYPSGRIVETSRDATGRVGGVTTKRNAAAASAVLASGVVYQPFGDLQSLSYGNGLSLRRSFTADDQLDQFVVENTATGVALIRRVHQRGDNGLNLTGIVNQDGVSPSASQSYSYSPARRLQSASGVWGQLTYAYGSGGVRTQEALSLGGTTTTKVTSYASTSNRMTQVATNGAVSRTFAHDGAGNLVTDTRAGTVWSFTHNAAGRLSQASVGGSVKGTYTYDGLERLSVRAVTNTTPSGTTHLIYDTAGHLLAEANGANGATIREYVWLEVEDLGADTGPMARPANDNGPGGSAGRLGAAENDNDPTSRAQLPSLNGPKRGIAARAVPLAVVADVDTASPQTLFVHADHLDRPIRMTNAAKALVWNAVYKPYGEVQAITGTATLDARFPGQWFQLETGLHHNWHRHYDPTTGRYLEPDPLGHVDGPSIYAYALGAPTMWTDREGLNASIAGAGIYLGARICSSNSTCREGARYIAQQIIDFCMAQNNNQTRERIASLQAHIDRHKEYLEKEPDSPPSRGWRNEIKAAQDTIDRLRKRLPNGR